MKSKKAHLLQWAVDDSDSHQSIFTLTQEAKFVKMEPKIIFEDESLLVIGKPSGMVVNRADTTAKIITVQDWAEKYLKWEMRNGKLDTEMGSGKSNFYLRAGIVHRLDKETSGLLLIAKTFEAFVNLQAQFKNREVKKKYLALVHGKVLPEVGEINAPVGRLPWNRERFGVMPGGKEAVTKYKVIKYFEMRNGKWEAGNRSGKQEMGIPFSLLEIHPTTGRTHQIRIHLQYLGFPIVGDIFYAGRKQALEDRKFCPRVFLHASFLSFLHPVTHENLEFNSPLPVDLKKIIVSITDSGQARMT